VRWPVVTDLDFAKLGVRERFRPVLFSLATGNRLDPKLDEVDAKPEAQKEPPTSESGEGRRA
jgi:hypothetical protein